MNTSHDPPDKIYPKPAFRPSIDLLIWAIIAMQLIVAIYGFLVLPDPVPTSWGANGHATGYGPKWEYTFLLPLLSIGIYVLVWVVIAAGPRLGGRQSTTANLKVARIILAGAMVFILIIQLAAMAQALGSGLNLNTVAMLAVSALCLFIGNFLGKLSRNSGLGIRTPWTLASSVVWERTHRLGGWLFVAVGLLGIPCSFIPSLGSWPVLVPVFAVLIFLCIYSYACYQRVSQERGEPLSPPFERDQQ